MPLPLPPSFPSVLVEKIASYLPRSDIRTLEKFSEEVETSIELSDKTVREMMEREMVEIEGFLAELIEDYQEYQILDPMSAQYSLKHRQFLGKVRRFLIYASMNYQWKFFSQFYNNTQCLSAILHALPDLEGLQVLDLDSCKTIPLDEIIERLAQSPNSAALTSLHLPHFGRIQDIVTEKALKALAKGPYTAHLQMLRYGGSEENDIEIIATMPSLQSLDLSRSDIKNIHMIVKMSQLRKLILKKCDYISEKSVEAIATMPNLQHLDLSYCSLGVTDTSLETIANTPTLKNLEFLDITECKNVTINGLNSLANSPYLASTGPLRLGLSCGYGEYISLEEAQAIFAVNPNIILSHGEST